MNPVTSAPTLELSRRVTRVLGRPVTSLRYLGRGVDHVAYDVDGTLVARVTARSDDKSASAIDREARLLDLVAGVSPIPVPTIVASDASSGITIATKIPGTSLLDEPSPQPHRLREQLGAFLASLRALPEHVVRTVCDEDDVAPDVWLEEAHRTYPRVAHLLHRDQRRTVEHFLENEAPSAPSERSLCHNDLGAEHLLAGPDRLALTGVIDWSDAAIADPAVDLGRLYRDLGAGVVRAIVDQLDLDPGLVMDRAAFYARCTLLEVMDHGLTTGDEPYVAAAVGNLASVF